MSPPPKLVHAIILLVILLVSSACGVSAADSPTATSAATSTSTIVVLPTKAPTPTSTPAPEWVTKTPGLDSASRTYHIDIPGVLTCGASSGPPNHSILPCYDNQYPLPANHPAAAELNISLDASWVTDGTYNCRRGTHITVGPGITGYENDGFSTPSASSDCSLGGPVIIAFWIANGVCYQLKVNGQDPTDTFMSRYGAIWQHMLASFVPAPAEPGGTTCS